MIEVEIFDGSINSYVKLHTTNKSESTKNGETTTDLYNDYIKLCNNHKIPLKYETQTMFTRQFKKYYIENNIEYMCLLEDDLILKDNFENFLQDLLPKVKSYNMIRLCNWGEGYLTSIDGARNILNHIYINGIVKNIDIQLRENCGSELHVSNTPFTLLIQNDKGDCLKTKKIIKWKLLTNKNKILKYSKFFK